MEIQIVAGFLGAGKTTFLNKYLPMLSGTTVVIENEFGEVGIDGQLIREDVPVKEIYAGCICCSLALDFRKGIKEIAEKFQPDRILIEPSGVGRLSDIVRACEKAKEKEQVDAVITKLITIVDAQAFEEYSEEFGVFYLDQVEHAKILFLSNVDAMEENEKQSVVAALRKLNSDAVIYDGDWRLLEEAELIHLLKMAGNFDEKSEEISVPAVPADKVFSSIAVKCPERKSREQLENILESLKNPKYGYILRAKGRVKTAEGEVLSYDFTPFAKEIRTENRGEHKEDEQAGVVIGCGLNEEMLRNLLEL